jgi:hypothetical protein
MLEKENHFICSKIFCIVGAFVVRVTGNVKSLLYLPSASWTTVYYFLKGNSIIEKIVYV